MLDGVASEELSRAHRMVPGLVGPVHTYHDRLASEANNHQGFGVLRDGKALHS